MLETRLRVDKGRQRTDQHEEKQSRLARWLARQPRMRLIVVLALISWVIVILVGVGLFVFLAG